MGIFNLFRSKPKEIDRSITTPWAQLGMMGFIPQKPLTIAEFLPDYTQVSKRICMGVPAIRRCVLLIAEAVAGLPIHIIRYDKEGNKKRDTDHFGYKLLTEDTGTILTPYVLKRELIIDAIFGNGLAWIQRDAFAEPSSLVLLDPDLTTYQDGVFKTKLDNQDKIISPADVFHLRAAGANGLADELVKVARKALHLTLSLQEYADKYFINGSSGTTYMPYPAGCTTADKQKEAREQFASATTGQNNFHKVVWTAPGSDPKFNPANNEQSQFIESREHNLLEVANLFEIPASFIGAANNTSYKSLEEMQQAFLDYSLNPWLKQFEAQADQKLRTETEKRLGRAYYEFERKAIISMKPDIESGMVIAQVNNGLLSEEEGRRVLNLPPENEDETYRRAANIIEVGEEPAPIKPPPQPLEQPPDASDGDKAPEGQEPDITARKLASGIVERLLRRMGHSHESGKVDMEIHREAILEHLEAFPKAEEFADNLIALMEDDIKTYGQEAFTRHDPR